MIGLLALAGIGLWITVVIRLSKLFPAWLGIVKFRSMLSVATFFILGILPFADDIVGKWQFRRLCAQNDFVTLSADWNSVKRAVSEEIPTLGLDGYVIPISVQKVSYLDLDTQKQFLTFKAFHTKGGFLERHLYGMDGLTSCWPKKTNETWALVKINDLIRAGENASKSKGQ
ncbi:MAG: hypothetical protein V4454_18820 [Pseudomonadota bacterium]